ncbi:putative transmembrane protein [Rhizoctonia solani 123E]|uniref:Putative transmembrane protein n=1 Tax=Rhizoctonia solani 123E TaxID=1423351 RepID=A0A074ST51_9AGAM|nr:putative transmembrane protein [Rhizoctonia solani 123E]
MFLGTIFNVWLYGIIAIQASTYYASFPRDTKWIKIIVTWLLIVETLNSAFDIGLVWRYTIILFGDLAGLGRSHWFLNIVTVSSTVQSFFAWRIVKLTGRVWLGCMIGVTILVQFAAGLGGTIGGFIVKDFGRYQELTAVVITWLVSSVVTDTVITSILTWYLYTHRTGYSRTDDIISRLARNTIQTGLMVTVWAALNLILFVVMSPLNNTVYLIFQLPLCKLYTVSLLSTLNSRREIRGTSSETRSVTAMAWRGGSAINQPPSPHAVPPRSEGSKPNISLERSERAIHIVTTTSSQRDDEYEMRDYKNTMGINSDDIEAYPPTFSVTTAEGTSGGVVSEPSVHSTMGNHD